MRLNNLIGKTFGRLRVIRRSGKNQNRRPVWRCVCECGKVAEIPADSLRKGSTKSCGCLRVETARKRKTTHGMAGSLEHLIWKQMRRRCENPKHKQYIDYGGRGITVCRRWWKFSNFFKDMGKKPDGKSIDRINNDGGYKKSNCKWSTPKEQATNRRSRARVLLDRIKFNLQQP